MPSPLGSYPDVRRAGAWSRLLLTIRPSSAVANATSPPTTGSRCAPVTPPGAELPRGGRRVRRAVPPRRIVAVSWTARGIASLPGRRSDGERAPLGLGSSPLALSPPSLLAPVVYLPRSCDPDVATPRSARAARNPSSPLARTPAPRRPWGWCRRGVSPGGGRTRHAQHATGRPCRTTSPEGLDG